MPKSNHDDSRTKWNLRHAERELATPASEVLQQHAAMLPKQGNALDLACGLGRNAIFLAQQGLECDAIDVSDVALARLKNFADEQNLKINTVCADIEKNGLASKQYDVIVVSYFLYRPLFEAIQKALKPGGLLFYQTFVQAQTEHRTNSKPVNTRFCLKQNELCVAFQNLKIHYYNETPLDPIGDKAPIAMLVASKLASAATD
ncbi:class I SAM-dependent methyltransferase [Zhongshania aliphaticivorans]|uniref:class I SAM-dependent methyltransferase n=1 Tax=Zhongshania aliphaticivorans TaxID=1470434 RepID=UPI0012E59A08|nr:methyltransferase domain-containing protein [Zhongshania aliphaticivorans]CAA0110904.1 Tellurite methyltransferase [Zhongshania aliphaticivorans]